MRINIEIDDEILADVIDQGAMYGIHHWGELEASFDYILKVLRTEGLGFSVNEVDPAHISDTFHERELIAVHLVTSQDIQRGLELMSTLWHKYIGDMIEGDYDCITGDLLLQLTLFGEVRYD